MSEKFFPINDQVLVRPIKGGEAVSPGGIVTVSSRPSFNLGEVVEVGSGHLTMSAERVPLRVQKGQEIAYRPQSGVEITVDNESLLVMQEGHILGVFGDA